MIRPIAMLPNILTTLNMACGFWAMTLCLDPTPANLTRACWLVMLAAVFDALDGRVARWAKVTSKFGIELDSLADLLSFGVTPALLAYAFGLQELGGWGRFCATMFAICGALRLARFNVGAADPKPTSAYYFQGSPIPAAAGMMVSLLLYVLQTGRALRPEVLAGFTVYGALMMVSSFPYPSAKKTPQTKSGKMFQALALASIMMGLYVYRASFLIACSIAYMASGPLFTLVRLIQSVARGSRAADLEDGDDVGEAPQ